MNIKIKPTEHIMLPNPDEEVKDWEEDSDWPDSKGKALPKSDHIKESQFIKTLKPVLNKLKESDIRILNSGEGAREKIQITQYPSVCINNRQIFDVTGLWKTRSQLDALCHRIGAEILQFLFIVRKDIPLSKRTQAFIASEKVRVFRNHLAILQQEVKDLCEFLVKGIVSEEDFNKEIVTKIDVFETSEEQVIAAKIVDALLDEAEVEKTIKRVGDKLRQRKHRSLEAKYSKLEVVG